MPELKGRPLIESRFGPLGCGQQCLTINGTSYTVAELMAQAGVDFDDSKPIDALAVPEGHYMVRYFDGQDSRIVAYEFDANFKLLNETRAHIAEWLGEDALYSYYAGH